MTAVAGQNVEAVFRLTPTQEGILYHTLLSDEPGMYMQQFSCTLVGDVRLELFQEAWQAVVTRHSVLRSLVIWEGLEDPVQLVRREVDVPWHVADLSRFDEEEAIRQIELFSDEDILLDFELDQAPLMRFAFFRLSPERVRFIWTHHHVILDGWSINVVLGEVLEAYQQLAEGSPVSETEEVPYQVFATHLASREKAEALTFWEKYLGGVQDANHLNASGREPESAFTSTQLEKSVGISQSQSDAIRRFAGDNKLTLDTVFRTAWAILVSRYSGSDDVVFGTTVSGRPPELEGALEMVGLFINTLPVRVQLDNATTVRSLCEVVQADRLAASEYEWMPLPDIQSQAETRPGQPLFTSLFVMENQPGVLAGGRLAIDEISYRQPSNFSLAMFAFPDDEIHYVLLHDPELFDDEAANRLIRQFANVVDSIVSVPDQRVTDVALFPGEEIGEILDGLNRTEAEVSGAGVLGQILEQSANNPVAPALIGPDGMVTYRQLVDRARQLARALRASGVSTGDRVAIAMERSPAMFVAIVGVMMSGAAYVPLDPQAPAIRLRRLSEELSVRSFVQDFDSEEIWDGRPVHRLGTRGELVGGDAGPSVDIPLPEMGDPAYVIFTSGSQGAPKGVVVTHENLAASNNARRRVYDGPVGRFLLLSPFYFDSSVVGIFWTLTTGGALVLPAPGAEQDVPELLGTMEQHDVTHLLALPSVYDLLLTIGSSRAFDDLEVAIVAGEPCPPRLVERHDAVAGGAKLYNEYGPTEATVWATVQQLSPADSADSGRVPIGRPIPNVAVYLLDPHLRPVPRGVAGELYISGPTVAAGYWARPEETERSFVQADLPGVGKTLLYRTGDLARYDNQGRLDLLGRVDRQVKVSGRRIEPGEIEAAISGHDSIGDAAVVVAEQTGNLAAYYTTVQVNGGIEPAAVADYLSDQLPDHLVPVHIARVDQLPTTANGKVDYNGLAAKETSAQPGKSHGARTDGELLLIELTSDLLGHRDFAITDNFFDAGGHSLLSMHLISRVFKETGVHVSPNTVLHNSLRYVARDIDGDDAEPEAPDPEAVVTAAAEPLFIPGQRGDLFVMLHRPDEFTGVPVLVAAPYGWEYYKTHSALKNLARYLADAGHPVLRPDYSGTGDSGGEPGSSSFGTWVEDLRSAASFLASEFGTEELVVVGLRTGASVALTWAATDDTLSRLILWDPVVYGGAHLEDLDSVQTELFATKGRDNAQFNDDEEIRGSTYGKQLRSDLVGLDLTTLDLPSDLNATLVVSADRDDYRELVDAAKGRIRLEVIEDAGHWTDIRTFNSAVVPARIPRHIVQLMGGSDD